MLAAFQSLYHFLTIEAEDEHGNPYFERNVMKRIRLKKQEETLAYRASQLTPKLFLGNESHDFLDYINFRHEASITITHGTTIFLKNKERDIAIIALFLLSGVRIAEVVNLDIEDLNVETMRLSVTCKDGKKD